MRVNGEETSLRKYLERSGSFWSDEGEVHSLHLPASSATAFWQAANAAVIASHDLLRQEISLASRQLISLGNETPPDYMIEIT